VTVRCLDESLGLEVDTSDEELEERPNDEPSYAEDTASSNDSESEPSSPFTPKFPILPSLVLPRRQDSARAEESATGKSDRQQPRQCS
jgi:hypothetical protein